MRPSAFQARAPRFRARAPRCYYFVSDCSRQLHPTIQGPLFAKLAARSPSLRSSSREWMHQLVGFIDATQHGALGFLDAAWNTPHRSCLASTHSVRAISDKTATGARAAQMSP